MSLRKKMFYGILACNAVLFSTSCENNFPNENVEARRVNVNQISPEMAKVRDYVPKMAVIAHRGSTFWTPEETESAYRWAREMGADYLEADLQCSKDGVILALHDDNLKRTTDIENLYGEYIPSTRADYYVKHLGMTKEEAEKQVKKDKESFEPFYAKSYMYEELLKLDAGTWFNNENREQACAGFSTEHQYISTLRDLIHYAKGDRLKRDSDGNRVYTIRKKADGKVEYVFEYEHDPQDTGNRPGVYLEFKEAWLNPPTFEKDVYDELSSLDFNIIKSPSSDTEFYKNGKVNVGNTNGKVILQTFSLESLRRTSEVFEGKIPMCFLFWLGKGATDLKVNTPAGYADFINLGLAYKAHIIGPSIAGAPNNYPELNNPWQAYLIKRSGMLNHPYSFDSYEQMAKYFGQFNYGVKDDNLFEPPYMDGVFTNRTELSLKYFIDKDVRGKGASKKVEDPVEVLTRLGYKK